MGSPGGMAPEMTLGESGVHSLGWGLDQDPRMAENVLLGKPGCGRWTHPLGKGTLSGLGIGCLC